MFQHHCRACGQVFCSQCSSRNCTLPKFGIEKEVRVCEACYNKVNKFVYILSQKDMLNKLVGSYPYIILLASKANYSITPHIGLRHNRLLWIIDHMNCELLPSKISSYRENSAQCNSQRLDFICNTPRVSTGVLGLRSWADDTTMRSLRRLSWLILNHVCFVPVFF